MRYFRGQGMVAGDKNDEHIPQLTQVELDIYFDQFAGKVESKSQILQRKAALLFLT